MYINLQYIYIFNSIPERNAPPCTASDSRVLARDCGIKIKLQENMFKRIFNELFNGISLDGVDFREYRVI